jgi:carbamoyl-phosphate synthase large subunit
VSPLIPLIDPELRIFAMHRSEFDDIGTTVLVSSVETNEVCFDKCKTAYFFNEHGIPTPKLFNVRQVMIENIGYLLLIKPATGSSSIGVTKIETLKEFDFLRTLSKFAKRR